MDCVVMNFSGIYERQDFKDGCGISCEDVSDIKGTDCYCDGEAEEELRKRIGGYPYSGIHYIDSGNYHYMSRLWIEKADRPFVLVVFDHHPDMQPPAFGNILSCGGWLADALRSNPFISKAVVIGVNEEFVSEIGEDIRDMPGKNKIAFITKQQIAREYGLCAGGRESGREDIYTKCAGLVGRKKEIYFSIDKDVLDESIVDTNWDQGDMRLDEMFSYIRHILRENSLLGVDVCGEPSYKYNENEGDVKKSNFVNSEILNMFKNFFT